MWAKDFLDITWGKRNSTRRKELREERERLQERDNLYNYTAPIQVLKSWLIIDYGGFDLIASLQRS